MDMKLICQRKIEQNEVENENACVAKLKSTLKLNKIDGI